VGAGSFTDLQNVQVLKGPQGTLFGRNTTGGAVLLVPKKPTDEFGGYIEGSAGDYDMRRVQAALNVPMSDRFRARLAVDANERDGYMHNKSGIGPKDYNDVGYIYGRFSLVADITPNIENYFVAHYSDSQTNGYASHIKTCDPTAATAAPPRTKAITALAACEQIARQNARGDDEFDVEVDNPHPYMRLKTWQVINTTTWKATDALTLKNIASYGEFHERERFNLYSDNFFISNPAPVLGIPNLPPLTPGTRFQYIQLDVAPGGDNAGQSSITEELQLQGSFLDNRFNWVSGVYLEFSRPIGWNAGRTGIFLDCSSPANLDCANPIFVGTVSDSRTKFDFDNHGIFTQGTFKFTDQWSMTLGARYTFDKIKAAGESTRIALRPTGPVLTCNDTVRFQGPGGVAKVVADPSQCHFETETKSDKPTWLIDFDYKPVDTLLLYAKYARGYRQGGINLTNVGQEIWNPEQVDAYELGSKLSFAAGPASGYFNVAAFYNDFTDMQIFGSTLAKPGVGAQAGAAVIINAGKSTIQGIEVDSSIKLFDALRFDLGYTYLDTKLKEITVPTLPADSPYSAIIPTAIKGAPLTLSPKHRVSLSAAYTLPLDDAIGNLTVGATYVYTSEQIANGSVPADVGVIPETNILNLNVDWNRVFNSPVDAAFFMTNATNETYPVNTGGGWSSAGFGDVLMGQPRMYGVRVRYSF
jgi:iron complex outermembrane receptor protein